MSRRKACTARKLDLEHKIVHFQTRSECKTHRNAEARSLERDELSFLSCLIGYVQVKALVELTIMNKQLFLLHSFILIDRLRRK